MRIRFIALIASCLLGPANAAADWQAVERVETYKIKGTSGAELYASIGERGPKVGGFVRAIAHTSFKLTWTRDYQPQDGGCVLASARPKLIITYTLPKPAGVLPASTRQNWETFIAGVTEHEKVHGDLIKAMVSEIETVSVGLSVGDDPKCRKIRRELTRRLGEISVAQRQKSRDFDQVELGNGGNVHQLILRLVNGG